MWAFAIFTGTVAAGGYPLMPSRSTSIVVAASNWNSAEVVAPLATVTDWVADAAFTVSTYPVAEIVAV